MKKKTRHYAMLLPIPADGVVRDQVVNPNTNDNYKDQSKYYIELMFYGAKELENSFYVVDTPGNGKQILFRGDKKRFANNTNKLDKKYFYRFKPLFATLVNLCENKKTKTKTGTDTVK